ncbi:MAG TPA: hypothetical protein G4O15_15610 [Dehalococcoidia bacterium]|nr:hypothetical protein [Dehalococcoidia bacterium]
MDTYTLDINSQLKIRNLMLLWGALFSLVVTDGIVTQYLITHGIAWELNPFLASFIDDNTFILVKALGVLLAISILWDISKRNYRIALAVSSFFVMFYTLVVVWNTYLCTMRWM